MATLLAPRSPKSGRYIASLPASATRRTSASTRLSPMQIVAYRDRRPPPRQRRGRGGTRNACYAPAMVTSLAYPSLFYTVVLSVSYWAWIALEMWLIVRERRDAGAVFQDRGSRTLLVVSLSIAVVFGIFTIPHVLPQFTMHSKAVAIGVALVWAGIAFRLWAIRTLGRFFNTRVVVRQEHRLITAGPYRYLRNPAYTGIVVTFLGFGVAIGNWISLITLLVFGCLPFTRRIAVEDRALAARFGHAYAEYRRRTWSLIPFIW